MNKVRSSVSLPMLLVFAVLIGGAVIIISRLNPSRSVASVDVAIPAQLSGLARQGKVLFEANCATCHGEVANGTDQGPPLVHDFYNPGHHADEAFLLAVRYGVRAHHWSFGNMPPQPQVNAIVRYVRELQQANGITYRAHQM